MNEALIGERWRIGADLLLEVSCPRIPCGTFQGWMGRRGWVKRFTQAALPADHPGRPARHLQSGRLKDILDV
ncbi:MAG TPA: MOSC domain-containing protein [Streptosporangiaceae bacterium]|nr:MOSC domain-containing protein [Streptosporangiaceae bacterium]